MIVETKSRDIVWYRTRKNTSIYSTHCLRVFFNQTPCNFKDIVYTLFRLRIQELLISVLGFCKRWFIDHFVLFVFSACLSGWNTNKNYVNIDTNNDAQYRTGMYNFFLSFLRIDNVYMYVREKCESEKETEKSHM